MLAVQVNDWAVGPKAITVPLPAPPSPSEIQVTLVAAGIHQLVRSRAAGRHYTNSPLPHRPGIDGVGIDAASGAAVYFSTLSSSTGSFAQTLNVPRSQTVALPAGVALTQAAALINPIMSSWMALVYRAGVETLRRRKPEGWAVLILGSTSVSGRMAVRVARAMGVTRVVGAARSKEGLATVQGLDERAVLKSQEPEKTDFAAACGVDVVLDYVYGPYAEAYLRQLKTDAELTYVSVGALAGPEVTIPSSVLRKNKVVIMGAGLGSWSQEKLMPEMEKMLSVLKGVEEEITEIKLEDVEKAWKAKGRVVLVA
ncbi:hypothetical protein BROUX41_006631 [Berkeleyomyces rouxiae]|uniref:uncharacterized protein n=1 Tax=Berkeleyomyces rouxiae TaxID=2035830 RepID=UPI003B7A0DB6